MPKPPFLFIDDFGVKKDALVKNLRYTKGEKALFACGHEGTKRIDISAFLRLTELRQKLPTSQSNRLFTAIRKIANGTASPMPGKDTNPELTKVLAFDESVAEVIRGLPLDPHERMALCTMVK